ncbi:hypothetical protein ACOMHN_057540 [Nucella lapillus]
MYPKPKCAPAGRVAQSKLAKNRTNATKEMEAWAKKADEAGTSNASRMSGQLSDNVTEERMLRAKLWELSKERYKVYCVVFLAQNAYEKKVFTDRMQRKSSLFVRRASSAVVSASSREGESSRAGQDTPKQRWQNARSALLDRMDPTKRNKSAQSQPVGQTGQDGVDCTAPSAQQDDDKREERTDDKGSAGSARSRFTPTVSIRPASDRKNIPPPLPSIAAAEGRDREETLTGKPPVSPITLTGIRNVNFHKYSQSTRPTGPESRGLSPRRLPSSGLVSISRPPSASSKPASATSQQSAVDAFQGRQGILASRYGMRLETKTEDPRYALLEKSLSPLQKRRGHSATDVTSIVRSFDSLHVPPRRRKEAKPKIELKALEYMEEQGFLFLLSG